MPTVKESTMIKVTSGFLAIVMLAAIAFTDAAITSTFAAPVKSYPYFPIFPKDPRGYENQKWWWGWQDWPWIPFRPARPGNPRWK
jgi:hypothetical protein